MKGNQIGHQKLELLDVCFRKQAANVIGLRYLGVSKDLIADAAIVRLVYTSPTLGIASKSAEIRLGRNVGVTDILLHIQSRYRAFSSRQRFTRKDLPIFLGDPQKHI